MIKKLTILIKLSSSLILVEDSSIVAGETIFITNGQWQSKKKKDFHHNYSRWRLQIIQSTLGWLLDKLLRAIIKQPMYLTLQVDKGFYSIRYRYASSLKTLMGLILSSCCVIDSKFESWLKFQFEKEYGLLAYYKKIES